jgi:hypothetical protein
VRRVLCPVCLQLTRETKDGRVAVHNDDAGSRCWMVGKPTPQWDERATRAVVAERSGGICEYCQSRRATDMHHRKSRGVGGAWTPENIIHLCSRCHSDATSYRTWAKSLGLVVLQTERPGDIPVVRDDCTTFQPTNDVVPPRPAGAPRRMS